MLFSLHFEVKRSHNSEYKKACDNEHENSWILKEAISYFLGIYIYIYIYIYISVVWTLKTP